MAVKFNLSVNNTPVQTKKQGSGITGFSVKSFDLGEERDIKKLHQLFQSNCYSNNVWGKVKEKDKAEGYTGSCCKKNYIGMFGIVIDIDEPGMTLEEAKECFKDYIYILHTSSSHLVNKPDKGGAIARFRLILPFEPAADNTSWYTSKSEAERLYNFLKKRFPFADPSVFEIARKYYPFAGQDRSKYEFHFNSKGKYISFDTFDAFDAFPEEVNNKEITDGVQTYLINKADSAAGDNADSVEAKPGVHYNSTTGEPYYSPSGEDYLLPDEVIKVKLGNDWKSIAFQELKENMLLKDIQKVVAYCKACDDINSQSASAFIYKDFHGFFVMECDHCRSELEKKGNKGTCDGDVTQYRWQEYPISSAVFSQNKKIYEIKVRSAEHIGPHELSREEWKNGKEADFAFQYVKKNRYFLSTNFTINYFSTPELDSDMPMYALNFDRNEINISYPIAKGEIEDNPFIDEYIDGIFGKYSEFIKDWLALYTFTNYQTMPVLILVGGRATGKNTFVQMVGNIYPMLWAQWSGDRESFNGFYSKKLLWIDENAFGDKKSQYDEIKFLTGNEYVTVNEKFQPRYRVRNNIKVILTTNDFKPLAVKNEEAPKSEKDNNFFFFEFPEITVDKRDRSIGDKLQKRLGHYCRTELKKRFENISSRNDLTCRYVIPCPITEYSKRVYVTAKTDLELAVEDLIENLEGMGRTHIKYSELTDKLNTLKLLRNGYSGKHFITLLQKKKVIGIEQERTNRERLGYRLLNVKKSESDPFNFDEDFVDVELLDAFEERTAAC